jgi:hypothetical protein
MLGECIANHFLGSNNKIVAHDVLLSNIYAAAGRWDDVEKVQKDMKANWVKKSKAAVGSRSMKMSMFPREQQIKPKFKEKIFILGKIPVQMKDVEYVLVTNFILLMFRRSGRNTFFAIIVRSYPLYLGFFTHSLEHLSGLSRTFTNVVTFTLLPSSSSSSSVLNSSSS